MPNKPVPIEVRTLEILEKSIASAVEWTKQNQKPEGYWVARLESNASMEAEWLLAYHILGVKFDQKTAGVIDCLLNTQRVDGSWGVYQGAELGDLNATVEAYAALRVHGQTADSPHMKRARNYILAHGGVAKTRVFTKIWLAMCGEWPWNGTPTLPPEIIHFPLWFPFNLYNFASWARATIVPLTVISARRPVVPFPPNARLDELFPEGREKTDTRLPYPTGGSLFQKFLYQADKFLAAYTKLGWQPGREISIKGCLEWILRRQEADGCWAGIQPPWIYALMALKTEGYALDHPVLEKGWRCFDAPWAVEEPQGTFLQACTSPVWDTVLTQLALLDCGYGPGEEFYDRSLDWIVGQQIRSVGDWKVKCPHLEPGGWAFEYENDYYPDIDDAAVAMIVLARSQGYDQGKNSELRASLERALQWVLGMQSSNGGWAAFDKDNNEKLVSLIPFCDFGESLDPPSVDVTAHVVEALGYLGRDLGDPIVQRAVDYIRREQETEGSWFGRWGVNHIYGTAAVIPALEKVGENMSAEYIVRACRWLVEHQNEDGGWGESCASYMDDSLRGCGESTASQTAWALLAIAAQGASEPGFEVSLRQGVDYLHRTQTAAGTWHEDAFTGTGFPGYGQGARTDLRGVGQTLPQGKELSRGFMLRYHMYRHYFPLMALGRVRTLLKGASD
jgi:squalene-hopene/tetraprenyl-beta-curcumene cyclase